MNAVTTAHDDHGVGGGEHVIATDRAITLSRALYTTMGVLNRHRETNRARL